MSQYNYGTASTPNWLAIDKVAISGIEEVAVVVIDGKEYRLPVKNGSIVNNTDITIPAGTELYIERTVKAVTG